MANRALYRISARSADMYNYIMAVKYEPRIHLRLDFAGKIDRDRLASAIRLAMDAEPILGCRFVPRWIWPFWERLASEELDRADLLQEVADEKSLFAQALDEHTEPQIKAAVWSEGDRDRLSIKVNHQVADAGATKELGYLIARLYRKLEREPRFRPEPNFGSRSFRQIYRTVLPRQALTLMGRYFGEIWHDSFPSRSLTYTSGAKKEGLPTFVFKHFGEARLSAIREHSHASSATINDLLMTGMIRALVRQTDWKGSGDSAIRLRGTVDLRRYLQERRGEALCNLSSFFCLPLGFELGNSFEDSLARVKREMNSIKQKSIGLNYVFGSWIVNFLNPFSLTSVLLRYKHKRAVEKKNAPPEMTNMGTIDAQAIDFGKPSLTSAYLVVPASMPPMLISGWSGFRNTLTLSAGVFESAIPRAQIEELFELVDSELPG